MLREAARSRAAPDENLLVWTTTPWTLTSNVGAAVNPELTYLKVKLKGEVYYVAEGRVQAEPHGVERRRGRGEPGASATGGEEAARLARRRAAPQQHRAALQIEGREGDGYEIVGEVKGSDMLGWEYVGPFDDLPAQQHAYGFPEDVAKVTKQSGKWPAEDGRPVAPRHLRRRRT